MYWITISNSIITACTVLGVISAIALICLVINSSIDGDFNETKPIIKILGIVTATTLVIACFLPSEKQWYKIYGISRKIEYVKNNPKAQQLSNKITDTLYLGKNTKIIKVK